MWEVTGWALVTFVKVTIGLVLAVGTAWLVLGDGSGWFWLITATAVVTELFLARQLVREWGHEASFRWWWAR
jgi:hypothetical protein